MDQTPRQMVRTDVWRLFVATGIVMALAIGITALVRTPSPSTGGILSRDAKINSIAEPAKGWKPRDPNAGPPLAGTVHKIRLEIKDTVVEVAPGVKQKMWTYNGTVPGPIMRGKIGDTFDITLVNKGSMAHSIDFHASKVAPNVQMRTINVGESLSYVFKATKAGIFMYHCGTAPVLDHISNGMYGALIVDPPDLAPVSHEFVMLESELYLGPASENADFAKAAAGAPDAVVFNGYYNQYKFSPVHVDPGKRVRVWVIDDGPSESESFHVIGTIFDTVYKEGTYLLRPSDAGGMQALDLEAAQGGFVEFTLDAPGLYPFVNHRFKDANMGALGVFQSGNVPGTMSH